jgi:AcrR family transcriptional regulator
MQLIERDTRDPVSMEALATHLGCSLMTLYDCVPSTETLLDSVARAALSGVPAQSPGAGAPWTDQVAWHIAAFRQAARAHPRSVVLAASRPPCPAPPGWPLGHALAALRASGLSDAECVRVARALTWYVLGSLLAQAGEDTDADFDFGLALVLGGADEAAAARAASAAAR